MDSKGNPTAFGGKGNAFYDERDFNNGTDEKDKYQAAKKNIASLEKAVEDAKAAEVVAKTLDTLKKEQTKATDLRAKVASAQQDVLNAKKALEKAYIDLGTSESRIEELKGKLKAAEENYDAVKGELDTAKENVASLETEIKEMHKIIDEGFKWKEAAPEEKKDPEQKPEEKKEGEEKTEEKNEVKKTGSKKSGGSSDDGTPAGGDTSVTTSVTSVDSTDYFAPLPDTGDTDAVMPILTGTTTAGGILEGTTEPGDNGDDDGDIIESGALLDGELPEGGVLGERMAPIVDAVENGTFNRGMMFTEEGLKVPFMWWLIIVLMGVKGVEMYMRKRKEEEK